jgi:serine/threonine-protein phosphatase 2A regulatory subunit B'
MAKALPKMTDVPAAERTQLLKQKMEICAEVFDFEEPESAQRDAKRQVLLECIEYISKKNVLTEAVYADALHMVRAAHSTLPVGSVAPDCSPAAGAADAQIKANLFRALPLGARDVNTHYDAEEDEPCLEPSWPHLQLVYEFFLRFIVSSDVDPKVAKVPPRPVSLYSCGRQCVLDWALLGCAEVYRQVLSYQGTTLAPSDAAYYLTESVCAAARPVRF